MKKFARIVYAMVVLITFGNAAWFYATGKPIDALINLVLANMLLTLDSVVPRFVAVPGAKPPVKSETTLTLVFPEAVANRLSEISRLSGAGDYTEVIRKALSVYDVLVETVVTDKAKIFIEMPDGKRSEFELLLSNSDDDKPGDDASTKLDEMAKLDFGVTEDKARELIATYVVGEPITQIR